MFENLFLKSFKFLNGKFLSGLKVLKCADLSTIDKNNCLEDQISTCKDKHCTVKIHPQKLLSTLGYCTQN